MNSQDLQNIIYNQCTNKACEENFTRWQLLEPDGAGKMNIVYCPCYLRMERWKKYLDANIPFEWFGFEITDIQPDFSQTILKNEVEPFIKHVKTFVTNRGQYMFIGDPDSGKTVISLLMLKAVIDAGIKGKIISASEIISLLYDRRIKELDEYDFLVIDEIDKLEHRNSMVLDFCNICASFMSNKSLILISNRSVNDIKSDYKYPEFFSDRLNLLKIIKFESKHYRERLKSKVDEIKDTLNIADKDN